MDLKIKIKIVLINQYEFIYEFHIALICLCFYLCIRGGLYYINAITSNNT